MFGCLVAGRLLQTNLAQIDETHATFEIHNATAVNHLCVFLLGTVQFPEGYGATVHFFWPGKGFQLLGMLSNEKPSAIFRVRGTYAAQSTDAHAVFTGATSSALTLVTPGSPPPTDVVAHVGISIEPLSQIQQEVVALPGQGQAVLTAEGRATQAAVMADRVVKNLFNYLSSFVDGNPAAMGADVMIPMGMIGRWYENFMAKLRTSGAGFLERQE
ncbi:DUF775-domain-containing protein [Epithele typhae]|uniref:DUF775-domain-containing protein n=1 Tax=Epithele typhae TaxID=378194 RepID=UPI002007AA4C|nr:DUF775-domain-containing protein [Epithele typhae]KAH9915189.1 DUF775-domain-containing protein [Epithele typhae]